MASGDTEIGERVLVPFHDDHIVCARDEARTFRVALKPTCEAMGLEYTGQFKRLQRQAWATIGVTPMVAEDGKVRDFTTLDRRTFAMWLATISASRIEDAEVREKVVRYQAEAADVLDRHFFGEPAETLPIEDPRVSAARQLLSVVERQVEQEKRLAIVERESAAALEVAAQALALASGDTGYVTLLGFCKRKGIRKTERESQVIGQNLSRIAKAAGVAIKKEEDEGWGYVNKYPTEFLERHVEQIKAFRAKIA